MREVEGEKEEEKKKKEEGRREEKNPGMEVWNISFVWKLILVGLELLFGYLYGIIWNSCLELWFGMVRKML